VEREKREPRQADAILRKASACLAMAALDRRSRTGSPSSTTIERPTGSSPGRGRGLAPHSGRGAPCLALRHAERLAEAGVEPSVGSVGGSCDNALAETSDGLLTAGVIHRRGPWRSLEAVEPAPHGWVGWPSTRRLREPLGDAPRAEARHHAQAKAQALAA
jgi:putative transposase